jgi:hypothetical protein
MNQRSTALSPEEMDLADQARKAFYAKPRTGECCNCAVEAMEEMIFLRSDDLVMQWELADPRDQWCHTGEPRPVESVETPPRRKHRTSQSTIDAFLHLVREGDESRLESWLMRHPSDAEFLRDMLESKKK